MATYKMLSNGSSGSDVKKLQQSLVAAGYDVGSAGVDGIYGSATAAAVKKYQKDNGLDVDGIAGDQTLGKLYSVNAPAAAKTAPATETAAATKPQTSQPQASKPQTQQQATTQAPDYSQYAYDSAADAAYQQALTALQQAQQQLPSYKGTYDQQLEDVYQQIVGRDKFSYDINGDALYQQYADQYTQRGQMAMMDTMGQAAALTGGYGNSYAQNVGQQAYQAYLQQLNDVVPELYGMALDQYNQEGDRLVQQYGMLGDMADTEYGRYQDALNQYWQNLSFQKQQADDAYNRGYNNWNNAYQYAYQAGRDQTADQQWKDAFDYQASRDQVSDQQWKDSFDYQASRDQVSDQQWQSAFDYQAGRDSVSDQQWQAAFDYQQGRDQTSDSQWQKQFEEAKRQYDQEYAFALQQYTDAKKTSSGGSSSGGSSGSSEGSSGGTSYDTHGYNTEQIKQLQRNAGITADGIWGPQTEKAYKSGYRPDKKATYNSGELLDATAAGMTKSQIEEVLKARGVDTSDPAVQADIKWALSK